MLINFKITNITCEACLKLSKSALGGLPGVGKITIAENGLTTLESDNEISWADIKEALEKVDKKIALI